MNIVHAADLHLDSPLRGLARKEGAPVDEIRLATRKAFRNLVNLCLEHRASLLLLAGDIYDGDWRDYRTGLFFLEELARLQEIACKVVLVRGNHDAESRITRSLKLPKHLHSLPTDQPGTLRFEDLGVAVHGQGYGQPKVTDNLASAFPAPLTGLLNIGLLHTNATGSQEHDSYAPCTVSELVERGYDYWALGHIHGAATLHAAPWVVYPGNLQGRNARETGPKGCVLIDIDDGHIKRVESKSLEVVRWEVADVRARPDDTLDTLLERAGEVMAGLVRQRDDGSAAGLLAVRVRLSGVTRVHNEILSHPSHVNHELRNLATDAGDVWIEKIVLDTQPLERTLDPVGQELEALLRRAILRFKSDPEALTALAGEALSDLVGHLRRHNLDDIDPARLAGSLLPQVEAILLDGVEGEGEIA